MDKEIESKNHKKPKIRLKQKIVIALFVIFGLLFIASGASILYYNLGNDAEGYAYSNLYHVDTSTYAFTAYMNEYNISPWGFLGAGNVAEIKYIATSADPTKELFIGYATTAASQAYIHGFQSEFPTYWHWLAEPYYAEIDINTTMIDGTGVLSQLPQEQTFWLASAQGSGTVTMNYIPQHEQHVWFIMNSDGSSNISADIQIAFRSPILNILPTILIGIGLIFIGVGAYILLKQKKRISLKG